MKMDVAQPSIAKRGLEKQSDFGLSDVETAYALSAPFTAGVSTVRIGSTVMLYLPLF